MTRLLSLKSRTRRSARKALAGFVLIVLLAPCPLLSALQLDTETKFKEWEPFFGGHGKKLFSYSDYDYGSVRIASRQLVWKQLTNRIMTRVKGQMPYLEFIHYDRDRDDDYTVNGGAYLNHGKNAWHLSSGFGANKDFTYSFQFEGQWERPAYKNLNAVAGLRYLHYTTGDVAIFSPGAAYYWKNFALSADYNVSVTESRGDAHWGTVRAYIPAGQHWGFRGGFAGGERLIDAFGLEEGGEQESFILFSVAEFRLAENIVCHIGYSYSEEKPSFIKRSINMGISLRF